MGWFAAIVVVGAVLWFLFVWYRWHRKQLGDANELEWLDELAQEHSAGIRDNSDKIERLIRTIENGHRPSATLSARLENVRRILIK